MTSTLADWWDKAGESIDLLNEGFHDVTITDFEVVTSKKGSQGVKFTFTDGERKIKDTFWISDAAMWRVCVLGKACGMPKEAMNFDPYKFPNYAKFVGKKCTIEVVETEPNDKGKTFMEVGQYIATNPKLPASKRIAPPRKESPRVTDLSAKLKADIATESDDLPF